MTTLTRIACAAASVSMLALPAIASADSTLTRAERIFPFEVGQQYEFQSARPFIRPNGEKMVSSTVHTITVSDTVIDGERWLHVPLWMAYGTEYYRLDDSLRILNYDPATGEDLVLLNLNSNGEIGNNGSGVPCSTEVRACIDFYYSLFPEYYDIDIPTYEAYVSAGPIVPGWVATGWMVFEGDSALRYSFETCCPSEKLSHVLQRGGASQHRQGGVGENLWGVFRPVSGDPWPELDGRITSIEGAPSPATLCLSAAPNPFNPSTTLQFSVANPGITKLVVYDVTGRHVRTLVARVLPAGTHSVVWDGTDAAGRHVASGVYVLRLTTSGELQSNSLTNRREATVRRVTLLR